LRTELTRFGSGHSNDRLASRFLLVSAAAKSFIASSDTTERGKAVAKRTFRKSLKVEADTGNGLVRNANPLNTASACRQAEQVRLLHDDWTA